MSLPKSVKDDDRPRHVRLAEQEFRRGFDGGALRMDHSSGRARLYNDNGDVVMRMTMEQATECFDALEDEYREHFVHVRDDLYAEDAQATTQDGGEARFPSEDDLDGEWLRIKDILDGYPLDRHYSNPYSGVYDAADRGTITSKKVYPGGKLFIRVDDEAFATWLGGLDLDSDDPQEASEEISSQSGPETSAEEEPPDDTGEGEIEEEDEENASEEPLGHRYDVCPICQERPPDSGVTVPMYEGEIVDPKRTDQWAGFRICSRCAAEADLEPRGDGMAGPARLYDDSAEDCYAIGSARGDTVEYRMERLREAHIAYIDVLHSGSEEEIETEREKVLVAWIRAGRLLERHWHILAETERQVLQSAEISERAPRVEGALSRATGDETLDMDSPVPERFSGADPELQTA